MSNQKGFSKIAIIIIVLILIGGAYFVFSKRERNIPAQNVENQNSQSSQSTDGDLSMSDWKTYRNEKYGFEIKYPNNLDFINLYANDAKKNRIYNYFELNGKEIHQISVEIIPFDKNQGFYKSAIEYTKPNCTGETTADEYKCTRIKEEKKFTTPNGINGYEFYMYVDSSNHLISSSVRGPIFGYDISTPSKSQFLSVNAWGYDEVSQDLINQVFTNTLKIMK